MGTLYCDGGSGTYLGTTLAVSLNTPADVPASWTPATDPEFWIGVIANGSNYKLKFWDDDPEDTPDQSNSAIANADFSGSPLEFQIAFDSNGAITNVYPDPNDWDGPQNLVIYANGSPSHGVKFKFVPTSSGGGTSTEGFSYSATLEVNSNGWLEYTIPTTSSAGTYYILKSSNGGVSWTQHGLSINHGNIPLITETQGSFVFDQTLIWIIRSPNEDELDRWRPTTKKVNCNFW